MIAEESDELKKLRGRCRTLAETVIAPRAQAVDQSGAYPWENVAELRDAGLMGYTIPKAYGGQGGSFVEAAIIVEEMARACSVTGRIAVESNMGAISAVMHYGSEPQKQLAAKAVLAGDKPAICITEPDAGSAASEMTTRADKRGDRYVLNGKKHWITGAGASKLHLIFARVYNEAGVAQGIGGFLAYFDDPKAATGGFRIGNREPTMGCRGIPEAEVIMEDFEVAEDMALIPPGGWERGFARLMNAYNSQRVGAAAVALGIAQGAFEHAIEFVKTRQQFGRPIGEFQGLQWMLADMAVQINAARLSILNAAASADPFPDMKLAAEAKIFTSEMAINVTNNALQLFGARGYSRDLPLERMVRDARMFTIGGGTAQVLRTLVASQVLGWKLPQTRNGYMSKSALMAAE